MEIMQPTQANEGDQMMEAPEAESFTVCIEVVGDGTFMVGLESAEEPMGAPEGAEEAPEPGAGMKPARDVKEALTIALSIIRSGGKQEQAMGEFKAGYDEMGAR